MKKSKAPPLPSIVTRSRQTSQTSQPTSTADDESVTSQSVKKPKRPKCWHPQQAIVLKQWAEIATSFRWMHHQTHLKYASLSFWMTLPVIVLSSITGTMNFAQGSLPSSIDSYAPVAIGTLNLIAGVITTVASFLRASELAEGHRVASVMFGKLSRNIRTELLLPLTERTMDGDDFIAMCRSEMDRLTEQTPDIPKSIEYKFAEQFEELLKNDFYPPELLNLHPVDVYDEQELQKDTAVASVVADAALQFKRALQKDREQKEQELQTIAESAPLPAVPPETVTQELQHLSKLQTVTSLLMKRKLPPTTAPAPPPQPSPASAPAPPVAAFFVDNTAALDAV